MSVCASLAPPGVGLFLSRGQTNIMRVRGGLTLPGDPGRKIRQRRGKTGNDGAGRRGIIPRACRYGGVTGCNPGDTWTGLGAGASGR